MPRPIQVNTLKVHNLVNCIYDRSDFTKKDIKAFLKLFKEVVLEEVAKGNAIRWYGFGTFVPLLRRYRDKDGHWQINKSALGMAFYPSSAVTTIKPLVDVNLLLERGEYDGPRHIYAQRCR